MVTRYDLFANAINCYLTLYKVKNLCTLIWALLLCSSIYAQQTPSIQFLVDSLSPSQFIERELLKSMPDLASNCTWAYSSIKFTIQPNGDLIDVLPAVGVPELFKKSLIKAIKGSQGKWVNKRGTPVDCILPLMIFPANRCPEDRPFRILQAGAQMLKYEGEYIIFPNNSFSTYNRDMVEGVILSPILLHDGTVH